MVRIYSIIVLLAIFALSGCGEGDGKRYTVIDHTGNVYKDMRIGRSGLGWTSFYTPNNKRIVFSSPYTYIEQQR